MDDANGAQHGFPGRPGQPPGGQNQGAAQPPPATPARDCAEAVHSVESPLAVAGGGDALADGSGVLTAGGMALSPALLRRLG